MEERYLIAEAVERVNNYQAALLRAPILLEKLKDVEFENKQKIIFMLKEIGGATLKGSACVKERKRI